MKTYWNRMIKKSYQVHLLFHHRTPNNKMNLLQFLAALRGFQLLLNNSTVATIPWDTCTQKKVTPSYFTNITLTTIQLCEDHASLWRSVFVSVKYAHVLFVMTGSLTSTNIKWPIEVVLHKADEHISQHIRKEVNKRLQLNMCYVFLFRISFSLHYHFIFLRGTINIMALWGTNGYCTKMNLNENPLLITLYHRDKKFVVCSLLHFHCWIYFIK